MSGPRARPAGAVGRWLAEVVEALRGVDPDAVAGAAALLERVRDQGGVIYTAGNGGSASTASHLALDLQKAAATRALCLTDSVGLITAWANDVAFDRALAQQLELLGDDRDAVVLLSVSGSSPNLIALLETARRKGIASVGLLGGKGGKAAGLVDVAVVVPSTDYGWVESVHVVLHHILTYALRPSPARVQPKTLAAQ